MSIEVSGLTKIYGEQKAVNNISFSIGKGEIVGFLGPNGAGKSTTMKMVTGYLLPDSGFVKVSGIDVKNNPIGAKKRIGYLPESNPLYYDMYVKEYLEFAGGLHQIENPKSKIENVIELVGLTPERKKKLGQLSKGYKQRVGLAASLLHEPEVLILDEPTSGLDPNQIIDIRNVIKEQGRNKTVLFSSHILQEVQAICDRVIIIHKGNIVADSSLQNLEKQTGKPVIQITFRESLESEWITRLPAVESAEKINAGTWRVTAKNVQEARKQLLHLSVEHNLNIVSLQDESNNLEEVFRALTKENK
ncbi:MAG: gliding motility protein GldA [Chitinophagaceae bacterium]|nr:gliding motility protein GldA [Chitinophagaceae bacterium]